MKATFRDAAMMAAGMMLLFMLLCQVPPAALVGIFSSDPSTIAYGDEYLRITSWNYVASGLIFVASSMFQAMGNTIPSLLASAARIALVAVPAVLMSGVPGFQLKWVSVRGVGAPPAGAQHDAPAQGVREEADAGASGGVNDRAVSPRFARWPQSGG